MVTGRFNIFDLLPDFCKHLFRLLHSNHVRHFRINVLLLFFVPWLHTNPKILFEHRKLVHVAERLATLCCLLKRLVNALRSAPHRLLHQIHSQSRVVLTDLMCVTLFNVL